AAGPWGAQPWAAPARRGRGYPGRWRTVRESEPLRVFLRPDAGPGASLRQAIRSGARLSSTDRRPLTAPGGYLSLLSLSGCFLAGRLPILTNEMSGCMQSDAPRNSTPAADKGLPPVAPPDARFLAKLFVVPLLIVSVLVGVCMLVIWWRARSLSPDAYLEKLDSSNWDIRWRGAEDLAQVLLRDDHLAANPKFSLDIAERLRLAFQSVRQLDKKRPSAATESAAGDDEPAPELKYLQFLTSCQGRFIVPVGVPLLNDMAVKADGGD